MAEETKEEEKVIDYLPTSKALGRKRWYFVWGGISITWIALIVVVFYFESKLSYSGGDTGMSDKISAIESSIDFMTESLEKQQDVILASRPKELPDAGVGNGSVILDSVTQSEFESVTEKITLLEEELKKVQSIKSDLEKEIAENKKAIAETSAAGDKNKKGPLIMALAQVQEQVRKGFPFDKELRFVEIQAKDDPIITQQLSVLMAHGGHGVISVEMLRDNFKELAGTIVSESKKAEEEGIWERTKNEFIDIISVRRVDNLDGDDVESTVARAEKALKDYNVSEAVLELDSLNSNSKKVVAEWLADASSRVAVEYALDKIWTRVTQIVVSDEEK